MKKGKATRECGSRDARSHRLILGIALWICAFGLSAQASGESAPPRTGFSLSAGIADFAGDFALGGGLQSPLFLDAIGIRVSGYCGWRPGILPSASAESWTPYFVGEAGLLGASAMIGGFMRVYGSGGVSFIAFSDAFSSQGVVVGGFGAFGFEVFPSGPLCYYVELGSHGIGARADKMAGSPTYLNGFSI